MYTGTLIDDLMATVDQAQHKSEQRRFAEERELHEIFAMQIPFGEGEHIFQGAA